MSELVLSSSAMLPLHVLLRKKIKVALEGWKIGRLDDRKNFAAAPWIDSAS